MTVFTLLIITINDDELTPCGEGNNFYSSAGMHLVSELVYIFSFDLCFDAL